VQYYIRAVIKHCREQWVGLTDGASNYKSLNHVRDRRPVCFVTFNHDTLLEALLRVWTLSSLQSPISAAVPTSSLNSMGQSTG